MRHLKGKANGLVMAAPRVWSLFLYADTGAKLLSLVDFRGLVGGLRQCGWINMNSDVLLGSFDSLYSLILGDQHFYKFSWSLLSCGREAPKIIIKNYIALYSKS